MPLANVELSNTFDEWRVITNQIVYELNNNVVLKEEIDLGSLAPFPELVQTVSLDSVEVAATPISSSPIDKLQLSDTTKIKHFKVGQNLRIYGARIDGTSNAVISAPLNLTAAKTGFTGGGASVFKYKIAHFDYETGKISPSIGEFNVAGVNFSGFNDTNNITLTFTRSSSNYGVLVYRQIQGEINTDNFYLVAVLGPRELVGNQNNWIDYCGFDYVTWSKKNSRNEYTAGSGLIHFPLTAPTSTKLGWADVEITFVDDSEGRITLKEMCHFEPNVIVAHDDTVALQTAINLRNQAGAKSLELATKTYFVQGLDIPKNFSLLGNGTKTTLRKLSWSCGNEDFRNKILKSSEQINDFSISNLTLDGNMQNQYLASETLDLNANYLVDITVDIARYENIKIVSAIGGGINASDSENVSVVSSFFFDSNLNDRLEWSPLDVSSSSEIVISSNIFRNFSGAVDASVVTTGSIIGNIVKNCGSGIIVYGATNLASSPNILMGPANEFLPTPDIYNSVYDSINIKLEQNVPFGSDPYTYQENGELFDLTANRAFIYHRVDKLQKIESNETLYGDEILVAGQRPLQSIPDTNLAAGEFRFNISEQNVNVLINNYAFNTLKATNPYHMGLVYRSILTEYVPSGNVIDVAANPALNIPAYPNINNYSLAISANTLVVDSVTNTLRITNANTLFKVGEQVYYNLPATNTAIGGLTANTIYYVSFANSSSLALSNTYAGANIDLNELRVTSPAESHALNKVIYTVKLANVTNLTTGSRVRMLGHSTTPDLDIAVGTILNYDSATNFAQISYNPSINIVTAGSGGQITVENSFVLAKGRIL